MCLQPLSIVLTYKPLVLLMLLFLAPIVQAQNAEKQAMAKLSFMVGDWKGKGVLLPAKNRQPLDVISEVRYDLNGTLLVIRVLETKNNQPVLRLHTVIYYNAKEDKYYYNPFSPKGLKRSFQGKMVNSQKIIFSLADNSYRLVFQRNEQGAFVEHGERKVNGQWKKNFENVLLPTSKF